MQTTKTSGIAVHIRVLIHRDLPEILAIEAANFSDPWTEEEFIHALSQRNCIGMIAEHEGKVLGFMLYEFRKKSLHVFAFAVHPDFQRQGVGSRMVDKLTDKLSSQRRTKITVNVIETMLGGQLFFKSRGFVAEKVIRGYLKDSDEDVYKFYFRLSQPSQGEHDEDSDSD